MSPWWLVPNLLALDAPAVAVIWQRFLGDGVTILASVALGATVWGIYLLDRVLDGPHSGTGSERHQFAARFPTTFGALAGIAFLTAAVCALQGLTASQFRAGMLLGSGVAAYLVAVHTRNLAGGKEVFVGLMFGLGVGLTANDGAGVVAFAGICVLNCSLIARWEGDPTGPGIRIPLGAALWAGIAAGFADTRVSLAVGVSLLLLGALHLARFRLGSRRLRALADAALLTPLILF